MGQGTSVNIRIPSQTPPIWFTSLLAVPKQSIIVCVDDSISIWNVWLERFKNFTNEVKLIHCKNKRSLLHELNNDNNSASTYLVDYEFSGETYTGIDLIVKILKYKKSVDNVFLVTSRINEENIKFGVENKICMIPKTFAPNIPITIIEKTLIVLKKIIFLKISTKE